MFLSVRGKPQENCKCKYAKFAEKLTFLPPDTHMYVCVSEGNKCMFFGKFCVHTKSMIPK